MAGFSAALNSEHDIGRAHDYSQWSVTVFAKRKIRHFKCLHHLWGVMVPGGDHVSAISIAANQIAFDCR